MNTDRKLPQRHPVRPDRKPALHDQGDARLITKGGGSGDMENIVWSMFDAAPRATEK